MCVICKRESSPSPDITESLVSIKDFSLHRRDRISDNKESGGDAMTYINFFWSGDSEVIYTYSLNAIDCIVIVLPHVFQSYQYERNTLTHNHI